MPELNKYSNGLRIFFWNWQHLTSTWNFPFFMLSDVMVWQCTILMTKELTSNLYSKPSSILYLHLSLIQKRHYRCLLPLSTTMTIKENMLQGVLYEVESLQIRS